MSPCFYQSVEKVIDEIKANGDVPGPPLVE